MLHIAGTPCASPSRSPQRHGGACPNALTEHTKSFRDISANAHAGSRTRVTSMGGLYDAATLRALLNAKPGAIWCKCPTYVFLLTSVGRTWLTRQRPCVLKQSWHRSHFGSRYKLGCCGHAGLFAGRIFRCDEFGVRACHARRPFLEPLKSLAKFASDEDSLRSVLEQPARQ